MLNCFSHVRFFSTLWSIAHQTPLSVGFSRQEYWSGLPFPSLGDLPNPGIEPKPLISPAVAGRFFTTSATWEALQLFARTCSPSRSSFLLQSLLLCLVFPFSCILSLVTFVYLPKSYLASSCPHPKKLLLFLLSPEHKVEARELQFLTLQSSPSLQWDRPFPHHQSFSF